jgi:putative membrane protein
VGNIVAQVSPLSTFRRVLGRIAGSGDNGDLLWRAIRDPRTIQGVGSQPDYRFSLANERTFLAWIRTALAFSAGGLAVAQFLTEVSAGWRTAIAVALVLMGAACSLWGLVHMTNNELAIRQRQELPPSRMPMVLAVTAAVGALILITVVI